MERAKKASPRDRSPWPLIGLTTDWSESVEGPYPRYELQQAYADAVLLAEGLPLALPYSDDAKVVGAYLDALDGLVVTGGAFDIPPEDYGEQRRSGCGPVKPRRTRFERALVEGALRRDLPLLAVCGGMQLLNVIFGGSLFQHLPADVPEAARHEQRGDRRQPSHPVSVRRGTRLAHALGEGSLMVNSTHHQAVHHLGEGLVVSALSGDGIVEGIEAASYRFVLGVQWHPEELLVSVPANLGLYRSLIKAASGRD